VVALTGKQYGSKLSLSDETLSAVRSRLSDGEDAFRRAVGYGFDSLTESEARYLARRPDVDAVRERILEEGASGQHPPAGGTAQDGPGEGSLSQALPSASAKESDPEGWDDHEAVLVVFETTHRPMMRFMRDSLLRAARHWSATSQPLKKAA